MLHWLNFLLPTYLLPSFPRCSMPFSEISILKYARKRFASQYYSVCFILFYFFWGYVRRLNWRELWRIAKCQNIDFAVNVTKLPENAQPILGQFPFDWMLPRSNSCWIFSLKRLNGRTRALFTQNSKDKYENETKYAIDALSLFYYFRTTSNQLSGGNKSERINEKYFHFMTL